MFEIHALHGFLGVPSDWQAFRFSSQQLMAHDVLAGYAHPTMSSWAGQFNNDKKGPVPKVLLGYSLGARLAMHALLSAPALWQGAILVSGHPGLEFPEERLAKCIQDRSWALKFAEMEWPIVINEWNASAVFSGSAPAFQRLEAHYNRHALSAVLHNWSLGMQADLKKELAALNVPILWVAGEKDTRYSALAQLMQFQHPLSDIWIAQGAAHRVPWESCKAFQLRVNIFLKKLEEANGNRHNTVGNNQRL